MRGRSLAAAALVAAVGFSPVLPAQAAGPSPGVSEAALRLARQPLAADDGWAAAGTGTGTTGGSAADAAHTFVVHNRAELVAALSGEAAPRIVFVDGRFSMRAGADNEPLSCTDYADPATTCPPSCGRTTRRSGDGRPGRPVRWRRPGSDPPGGRATRSRSPCPPTPPSSASTAPASSTAR